MSERRVPKTIINAMKGLQARADLKNFASSDEATTARIVAGTKLYRETWVDPVFVELIAWMEGRKPLPDRSDRHGPIRGCARDMAMIQMAKDSK